MRIDYCPKCNKAGLKYEDSEGRYPNGKTQKENWKDCQEYAARGEFFKHESSYGTAKWCPRCKEWVKPENHPYIGARVTLQ